MWLLTPYVDVHNVSVALTDNKEHSVVVDAVCSRRGFARQVLVEMLLGTQSLDAGPEQVADVTELCFSAGY